MSGNEKELPVVTLSRLNIANWCESTNQNDKDTAPNNVETAIPNARSYIPRPAPFPAYDFMRPEAYERMAADKPGEEMAQDATIWKLYLEEAEEHDNELVKGRQGSLDMLLLFAALFSAILTAFLIESKNLLQQDPADATTALLLIIARSQQRMELGITPPASSQTIDIPAFTPPKIARWINGIWFASLALALSAALIAMLCKEWLTAYLSSRPRHAYRHALLRQSRLEGLEKWWALHIISLLPSLLHLALLLFSVGLVMYLWLLDKSIAAVIAGSIGLTAAFYVTTAILGAIYRYCPYVTQISGYIQAAYALYKGKESSDFESSTYTSELDLRALLWLAENARDPAIIDCSYQALAGLRLPPNFAGSTMNAVNTNNTTPIRKDSPASGTMMKLDKQTTLGSLFLTVVNRFERLMRSGGGVSTSSWENAARYARVIGELFAQIQRQNPGGRLLLGEKIAPEPMAGEVEMVVLNIKENSAEFGNALARVLDAFNYLWKEEVQPLHSDVYANVVSAELFLLSYAAPNEDTPSMDKVDKEGSYESAESTHSYNITSRPPRHEYPTIVNLFELRAQYSRALIRASALIRLHTENKAIIGSLPLNRLMDTIQAAASCKALNPSNGLSSHHSQTTGNHSNDFNFVITYSVGSSYMFPPRDLGAGILGSITALLTMGPKGQDDTLKTRICAIRALSACAPLFIRQTFGTSCNFLADRFDYTSWPYAAKLDMNSVRYIASRYALELVRYISPHLTSQNNLITQLCDSLLLINGYLIEHVTSMHSAYLALAHAGDGIIPLLEFADSSDDNFKIVAPRAVTVIISLARVGFNGNNSVCNTFSSPSCFPPLIKMIQYSENPSYAIRELFTQMIQRMRNQVVEPVTIVERRVELPGLHYSERFTHTSKGFSALVIGASGEKHRKEVVEGAVQIVRLAAGHDTVYVVESPELYPDAVQGFLDVVMLVAEFYSGKSEEKTILLDFAEDVLRLIGVVSDATSKEVIRTHLAYSKLCSAIKNTEGDTLRSRGILERMLDLKAAHDIQDLLDIVNRPHHDSGGHISETEGAAPKA